MGFNQILWPIDSSDFCEYEVDDLMIWCKYEVVDGERDLNSLSVLWHSRGEQRQDANLFLYRKMKYFPGAAGEWVAAC